MLSTRFYSATRDFSTLTHHVPAPYMRRAFTPDAAVSQATLSVCGLGFYRVYLNGREFTKGRLAPYISNPDHYLYYDSYDVTSMLAEGENVLGFLLGNGFQNSLGGFIWSFDKAPWRSAPKVAFALEITYADGRRACIQADEHLLCHPSPILLDDERMGEWYDARAEIADWCAPSLDTTGWTAAIPAELPRGERRVVDCDPIVVTKALKPVSIEQGGIGAYGRPRGDVPKMPMEGVEGETQGYLYDFGVNAAGVVRLHIRAHEGQHIVLQFGEELMADGSNNLDLGGINFQPDRYNCRVSYVCREGEQTYVPSFTYFGFRYVLVMGLEEGQATEDLLTYEVMNSDLEQISHFSCSDETINRIAECARVSDLANFYYFPTDCPQREKNGWTGDAALSAEHHLLYFRAERSLREWMRNVRASQSEEGKIAPFVPDDVWGYDHQGWDYGPAWDGVIIQIPYYIYKFRGDLTVARETGDSILRLLQMLARTRNDKGLIDYGLGDWCHAGHENQWSPTCPRYVSNTILAMDLCVKSAELFDALGENLPADFARGLAAEFKAAIREHLVDFSTMTVESDCQAAQAMALFYGVFDESEEAAAFDVLLRIIERTDGRMDMGVLGARVMFHLLSKFGRSDVAYHMITTREFPSYGYWIHTMGATALFEDFVPLGGEITSHNHHFWGDVSSWFIRDLAGLKLNPSGRDASEIEISPSLLDELTHAEADHALPAGRVAVAWRREGDAVALSLTLPEGVHGRVILPNGWRCACGATEFDAKTGEFTICK